jgi:hypothetical protein
VKQETHRILRSESVGFRVLKMARPEGSGHAVQTLRVEGVEELVRGLVAA